MTRQDQPNWLLHLQLASLEQDERVMTLLRFPTEALLPGQFDFRVTSWSRGHTIQSRSRTAKSFAQLLTRKANKIRAVYTAKSGSAPKAELAITKITNILHISPTNSLWESASGYEPEGRLDRKRRRELEGLEMGLRWMELSAYPTLLESIIELEGEAEPETILTAFFDRLARSFPPDLLQTRIVGCADLVRHISFNILQALAPWPGSYKYLGERFDGLHTFLIGASSLTEEFTRLSLNNVERKPVLCNDGSSVLAVLRIPEATLHDPESVATASRLLVPKDETTAHKHEWSPARGEHLIGGNPMFTWRRTCELIAQGLIPEPEPGTIARHFINPKYCRMLGIDPDDMLADCLNEKWAKRIEVETNAAFELTERDLPIAERIWASYSGTWFGFNEAIRTFIRGRYFSDLPESTIDAPAVYVEAFWSTLPGEDQESQNRGPGPPV